jgi:hypothetical protein
MPATVNKIEGSGETRGTEGRISWSFAAK